MSDIVTRLRAVLHNDRSVELMNHEAAEEIMQLRQQVEELRAERDEARRELDDAREERDEARRLWCMAVEEIESGMTNETRYEVAETKGWDCFKENTND